MLKRTFVALLILLFAAARASATTTMNGLLWYGQSLAVGAFGLPLLTPFAPLPYTMMMYNSASGLYSINQQKSTSQASSVFTELVPAYDSYFSSLSNTSPGQTPLTPMAEVLSSLEGAAPAGAIFQCPA